MKGRFAIILLVCTSTVLRAQDPVHIYSWEEVQGANPDTIYGLSLEKEKLSELPVELGAFTSLRILRIGKNKLTSLPDFLENMQHLEELDAERNQLDVFPMVLCRMPSIQKLVLARNFIENVPEGIGYMEQLRFIDFYDTPIHSLPESLLRLTHLEKIDLTGVRFSPRFQENWKNKLPNVEWLFDAPCDCMN